MVCSLFFLFSFSERCGAFLSPPQIRKRNKLCRKDYVGIQYVPFSFSFSWTVGSGLTQRNSMFPINFSSKKGGFQGTSGEDWTKIVAHKHWLLRELYGRNSIVPHISTFPTIFVQKVRSKGALSSFLTGERAKPSLFVQHKLTQTSTDTLTSRDGTKEVERH